jgi:hypothetical protein
MSDSNRAPSTRTAPTEPAFDTNGGGRWLTEIQRTRTPNAWRLTQRGQEVSGALSTQSAGA